MPIVYGTTQVNNPGDGGLGPVGGMSRSNTTRLSQTFPVGKEKFDSSELLDVRVYYYSIYQFNLDPLLASLAAMGGVGVDLLTPGESPAFGAYRLNYTGAAPDFAVPIGPGGLPGTPYTPNIISAPDADFRQMAAPPARQDPRFSPLFNLNRRGPSFGYGVGAYISVFDSSPQQSVNKTNNGVPPVRILGRSIYVGPGAQRGDE